MNPLVMNLLQPILDQLQKLWARVNMMPVARWGTVVTASPLTVNLDGSIDVNGSPVPAPAQTAVKGLRAGDRVWCLEQHRRVTVTQAPRNTDNPRVLRGRVVITPIPDTPTSAVVTFPSGFFSSTPEISVTPITGAPGTTVLGVGVNPVAATGATIWLTRSNDTTTSVSWIAVGN